jgi:hypothetical protein
MLATFGVTLALVTTRNLIAAESPATAMEFISCKAIATSNTRLLFYILEGCLLLLLILVWLHWHTSLHLYWLLLLHRLRQRRTFKNVDKFCPKYKVYDVAATICSRQVEVLANRTIAKARAT